MQPAGKSMKGLAGKHGLTAVILNKGAGLLKSSDPVMIQTQIKEHFAAAGHESMVILCESDDLRAVISRHVKSRDTETIVVGGGDGSISASAAELVGTDKTLG